MKPLEFGSAVAFLQVCLEVEAFAELPLALGTLVRVLPRVDLHVPSQVGRLQAPLSTVAAHMLFQNPFVLLFAIIFFCERQTLVLDVRWKDDPFIWSNSK